MTLSIVMPYYENPHMLEAHLYAWSQYHPHAQQNIEIVIVDDGSPRNPAAPIMRANRDFHHRMLMRCFRIDVNIPWNQDGARNLGMMHAFGEWAFLTDMDHLVPFDQADKMLHFAMVEALPREYYMPAAQIKTDGTVLGEHPNTYLFNRRDYWDIGGYDEDFAGSYGSDGNFRKNAKGLGLREVRTAAWHTIVFRKEDISDACTHDFGRKESPYHRANFPELEAKRRASAYRPQRPIRFPWHEEQI